MNLRQFDLNLLRLLDAVLTEGSVSRAARVLRMSQPAVSQGLQRARDAFGDPLLARHGNRLLPTPRAQALQPELRAVLDRIGVLVVPSGFDPATAMREFVLAAGDLGQVLVLPPLVARIARDAPGCRVRIVPPPHDAEGMTVPDMVLMGAPVPPGPLRWRALFRDRLVMIARTGHPALGGTLTAAQFAAIPQVLVSPRSDGFAGPVDAALGRLGLRRRVAVMATQFAAVPPLLTHSDLVAAVPARFADLPQVQAVCGQRELPFDPPGYAMRMAWPLARQTDPAVVWLLGLVG
jgi:DNA-binding transcriptional LysR family regulator